MRQSPGQLTATPLRGKYLVRNRFLNGALRFIDLVLNIACRRPSSQLPVASFVPRRILLSNTAHLGDVLIFSSVIPALMSAFPNVQIGVAVGSWAKNIVESDPLIRWIHVIDHWKLNRSGQAMTERIARYLRTRRRSLREIREIRYDVAIDFYYHFPNSIPLLWQSGIPIRIGYGSGGFGPLLTHEYCWHDKDCHVLDYHKALLRTLRIPEAELQGLRPRLPPLEPKVEQRVISLLEETGNTAGEYVLMHIGTGHVQKEWPLAKWRELVERFLARGNRIIFTGTGSYESQNIQALMDGLNGCSNFSGILAWPEFVAVLSFSRLVVCVDSLAGHLAAAADIPCVVVRTGISHPLHWRPLNTRCEVLMASVPCSPCYRSEGCPTMDCVRAVSVSMVFDACNRLTA